MVFWVRFLGAFFACVSTDIGCAERAKTKYLPLHRQKSSIEVSVYPSRRGLPFLFTWIDGERYGVDCLFYSCVFWCVSRVCVFFFLYCFMFLFCGVVGARAVDFYHISGTQLISKRITKKGYISRWFSAKKRGCTFLLAAAL